MRKSVAVFMAILLMAATMGCTTTQPVAQPTQAPQPTQAAVSAETATPTIETKKWKVGYSNRLDSDEFLKGLRDKFAALAAKDDTLEVMFADADNDSQRQIDQVENFFVSEINVLVLVPNDNESLVPQVKQANEKGIPVICLSQKANDGDFTFVGISDYETGHMQGIYCNKNLPENAKVLYLGGNSGYQTSIDRKQGFLDGLGDRLSDKGGDVQILAYQECMYTMDEGMTIMEDWIQTFDDFDAVVAVNDNSALGAIQAMKAANILKGKIVCGIDAIGIALQAVADGDMTMTVMQDMDAQTQALYDCIKTLQNGGTLEKRIDTRLVEITKDNVADYM